MKAKYTWLCLLGATLALGTSCQSNQSDSSVPVVSSLDAAEAIVPEEVQERFNDILGCYEELGYSSLPKIGATYQLDPNDKNGVLASPVTSSAFEDYQKTLVERGFVQQEEGTYLDPLSRYFVVLSLNGDTLSFKIRFNDEIGAFPVNYLSTVFATFDLPIYLKSDTFEYAENVKGEDLSKKFLLADGNDYLALTSASAPTKTVSWTPKQDVEDPVSDVSTWLKNAQLTPISSSASNVLIDSFASAVVEVGKVSGATPSLLRNGAKEGDLYLRVYRLWSEELDQAHFAARYQALTGYVYDASAFPDFMTLGKAKSMLMSFAYGTYSGPGWVVSNPSKARFQAILDEFHERGWSFSQTDGSYYHSYNFYGPKNEYRVYLSYYDSSKIGGLLSDLVQIRLFQFPSIYERLTDWFKQENVGGGSITDIPEIPGKGVNGSSTSSNGFPVFNISATSVTAENYAKYVAALQDDGWKETNKNNNETIYQSADGFYYYDIIYANGSFSAALVYNASYYSGKHTYAELIQYGAKRLEDPSFTVPGLSTYVDVDPSPEITVLSFYVSDQRYLMELPLASAEESVTAVNAIYAALEADTAWTKAGQSSTGTVFYQNANGTYLYCLSNVDDSSNTPYLLIGAYHSA